MHIRLSREFIQRPLAGLYFSFLPLLCSLTPLFSFSLFIPSRCVLKGLARSKVLMARFILLNIPFSEWLFISILFKRLQTSQITERDKQILTSVLYRGCHVFCQGESWDHECLCTILGLTSLCEWGFVFWKWKYVRAWYSPKFEETVSYLFSFIQELERTNLHLNRPLRNKTISRAGELVSNPGVSGL